MNDKKPIRFRRFSRLLPILLLAAALTACGQTQEPYIDDAPLDYRGTALNQEEYTQLAAEHPDAEIFWDVPLSGGAWDSASEALRLTDISPEDIPLFRYFPALRTVDGTRCDDPEVLMALQEAMPELEVLWRVELNGSYYAKDTTALILPSPGDSADALAEKLRCLPELSLVTFTGGPVGWEAQDILREACPAVSFHWDTQLLGQVCPRNTTHLSFAGAELDTSALDELRENAFRLPALESIDLTGCGFDDESLHALDVALGDVDIVWTLTVYGVEVCSTDEEIDLSRHPISDHAAALEEVLPYFTHLKKIDLSRCGIPDQEMDALNQKYEDIRFVWTVFFSIFSVRTDETNFIAARTRNEALIYSSDCAVLRYCTDMIALDLGHRNLTSLDFLYDMPQLQYLILVENNIGDITPIGSLKELKYLEIFWTKVEDLTPLINCTELLDLNICYIYAKPDPAFEALMQMPWLERLWYCGNSLSQEQVEALRANMPDCEMYLEPHGESTGGTWRTHPRYYEMRDVFDMYYMPGGTNGVAADGSQIIISG